jgi:hypothetical protein
VDSEQTGNELTVEKKRTCYGRFSSGELTREFCFSLSRARWLFSRAFLSYRYPRGYKRGHNSIAQFKDGQAWTSQFFNLQGLAWTSKIRLEDALGDEVYKASPVFMKLHRFDSALDVIGER